MAVVAGRAAYLVAALRGHVAGADGNRKMFTGSGGDVPESPSVPATIGVRYCIVSLQYPPVERALETLGRCAEDVVQKT